MTKPAVNPETLSRYLTDRLSEQERDDFERLFTTHPELVVEIEETLRFREGLAVLRDRAVLPRLLQANAARPPVARWALAAAVATVAVATALWVWPLTRGGGVLAPRPRSGTSVEHAYTLVTVRGGADRLRVVLPAAGRELELRLLPNVKSPAGRYRVALERPAAGGPVEVAALEHVAAGVDGFVVVYARLSGPAGPYALAIEPEGTAGAASRFAIDLAPPGPREASAP